MDAALRPDRTAPLPVPDRGRGLHWPYPFLRHARIRLSGCGERVHVLTGRGVAPDAADLRRVRHPLPGAVADAHRLRRHGLQPLHGQVLAAGARRGARPAAARGLLGAARRPARRLGAHAGAQPLGHPPLGCPAPAGDDRRNRVAAACVGPDGADPLGLHCVALRWHHGRLQEHLVADLPRLCEGVAVATATGAARRAEWR
mmetsp:Transcript_118383/g.382195  ORF Transcript_118383/g.382195 Transcript_118383/m.382195 type:complete len:201 (+) Transcript_118383:1311-1913(+)